MAHISKREVRKDDFRTLEKLLYSISTSRRFPSRYGLQELLTETEKLMLAKRIALIAMLTQERSYYRIKQALGMSTSTIRRFHDQIEQGEYALLRKLLQEKKREEDFLDFLEKLSRGGMPPIIRYKKKRFV